MTRKILTPLEVNVSGSSIATPGSSGTNALVLNSTADGASNLINLRFRSANGNLFDLGKNETSNQSGSFYLFTSSALPIELYNGSTKRLIIESNGNINIGPTTGAGTARLSVFNATATTIAQFIRGAASQTADTLQIQSSAGTVLGGDNGVGQIFTGSTTPILTATGGTIQSIATGANPLVTMASAHGFAVGDLVTLAGTTGGTYNGTFVVASTPLTTTFTITSALTTGQAGTGGTASDPAQLSVTARSAGTVGQIVRGAASQAVDLIQTQTSGGTVNFGVDSVGSVFTAAIMGTDRQNAIVLGGSRNVALNSGSGSFGGGSAVTFIGNAATAPTSNPTGGGILFVNAGALQYRGTSGSARTIINADGTDPSIADATTATAVSGPGFMGLPQNATTTGSYTIVAADAGRHIYASATRTVTINSNANLALPIGTTITFVAGSGATMTIAITTDTLLLAGPGTTGSRTLAPFGMATAVKITSTSWIISGNGLT